MMLKKGPDNYLIEMQITPNSSYFSVLGRFNGLLATDVFQLGW